MIARAAVLLAGVLVYLYFLQLGQAVAKAGMSNLQYLYTHAQAEAAAINR
jgi:hypothetical protein